MKWNEVTGIDWACDDANADDAMWIVLLDKIKQELHL